MATAAIRLPEERAEQARKLAAHKGVTVADLVGSLVTDEIKRLGLGLHIGLGSIEVFKLEDGNIGVDYCAGVQAWTSNVASNVADAIENAISRKGSTLDLDAGIEVSRVGVSIKLKNIATKYERTLASSVAKDFVALLRHHTKH